MRSLCVVVALLATCWAENVIDSEELDRLVAHYMRGTLAPQDEQQFQQLAQVLAFPNQVLTQGMDEYATPRLTISCLFCRSVFNVLIEDVRSGKSDEEVILTVTNMCAGLGIESHRVCAGVVKFNMPIITYIIRQNPSASSNTFCGLIFQTTDIASCPFEDDRFEYEVDLPPPGDDILEPASSDNAPLRIALLSDAHMDPLYKPYGSGACGEPTCCRVGQTDATPDSFTVTIDDSFLNQSISLKDNKVLIDLDVAEQLRLARRSAVESNLRMTKNDPPLAGYWGDYRSCDTPLWAFDDIIEHVANSHEIDIVYYVGDTIDHGVWETSIPLIKNMNAYLAKRLDQVFGDVPVLLAIGNHESQPTNQFAPTSVTEEGLETHWLYDSLSELWSKWLTDEAQQTIRSGGYYSMLVRPGLRAIVINTNIAYKYNWWVVHDPQESRRHLQWLADSLYAAEVAGEKVHIISHIPPGVHDLTKVWTREYNRIISRFSSTITAEFNGHTHADEFKIYYSNADGRPINVAWNAGAMTSYTYYNVNYKIVTVDSSNYVPQDIETYMYNLTEANLTPDRRPPWLKLYDFRDEYGVTDLSASQLDNLVRRMVTTEKNLLDTYTSYFHKLSEQRMSCDDVCKINRLCMAVVTELYEREKCNEITELFHSVLNKI